MRPLNGHVLLNITAQDQDERKTEGGIIIPGIVDDDDTGKIPTGVVITAAEDVQLPLKMGDVVLYNNFSGKAITVDGVKCLLIKGEDLYGIK